MSGGDDKAELEELRRIAAENPGLVAEVIARLHIEELIEDPHFPESIQRIRRRERGQLSDDRDPLVSAEPREDWDRED